MNWKMLIAGIAWILNLGHVMGNDVDRGFLDSSRINLQTYWRDALAEKYRFTAEDRRLPDVLEMVVTRARIPCRRYSIPDRSVTLKGEEMTLREVLWEIKQQTGCRFLLEDACLIVGTKKE